MSDRRTDRLVLALRERILRGEFAPGERLTELGLAPLLGGSRTPVRLALERLAHEGLVEAVPSGGFRLRSFSIAEIWDQIEIRGVLEGTAARLAAERLDNPHELRRLRELAQDPPLDSPITEEDFSAYLERNEEFHRELWRLAKSAAGTRVRGGE